MGLDRRYQAALRIPTGFRIKARDCGLAATLGGPRGHEYTEAPHPRITTGATISHDRMTADSTITRPASHQQEAIPLRFYRIRS